MSEAYRRLGQNYSWLGCNEEAEREIRSAIVIQERLTSTFPGVTAYRKAAAESVSALAVVEYGMKRYSEAACNAGRSLSLLEQIATADASGRGFRVERASALNLRGMSMGQANRHLAAETDFRGTIALFEELAALFPDAAEYPAQVVVARNNLSGSMESQGRIKEAEDLLRLNLAFWQKKVDADKTSYDFHSKTALTLANLASLWEKTGRKAEAEKALRQSIKLRADLAQAFPKTPHHMVQLRDELGRLAGLASGRGDLAEARRLEEQAVVHSRAIVALAPTNADYRARNREALAALTETLLSLRVHDQAATSIAEMIKCTPVSTLETVRAAAMLARCAPLAASDLRQNPSLRTEQARRYADGAVELLRRRKTTDLTTCRCSRKSARLRRHPVARRFSGIAGGADGILGRARAVTDATGVGPVPLTRRTIVIMLKQALVGVAIGVIREGQ